MLLTYLSIQSCRVSSYFGQAHSRTKEYLKSISKVGKTGCRTHISCWELSNQIVAGLISGCLQSVLQSQLLKITFFCIWKYNCVYPGAAQFFWSQCQNGFHSTNCSHRSNPTQPGRGGNLMTVETSFSLMTSSTSSFHSALSMLDKGSLQTETKSGHFVYHNLTLGYKS